MAQKILQMNIRHDLYSVYYKYTYKLLLELFDTNELSHHSIRILVLCPYTNGVDSFHALIVQWTGFKKIYIYIIPVTEHHCQK